MDLYPIHPASQPSNGKQHMAEPTRKLSSPSATDAASIAPQVADILKQKLITALTPGGQSKQDEKIIKALAGQVSRFLNPAQTPTENVQDELARAKAEAAHWKAETSKMDQIANEAMQKLEQKRKDKHALKEQCEKWKERYQDLASSSQKAAPQAAMINAKERADIQEKLMIGGQAFRELKELRPALEKLQAEKATSAATIARLQGELQALKSLAKPDAPAQKVRELEMQVAAGVKKVQALELDLASGKDKLRAATADASAKTTKLMASKDMLVRAEQVLRTCSHLHASRGGESSEFSEALTETSQNLAQFIRTLEK